MIQYWIQTPIENARETVGRFLADNSSTLTAYEDFVPYYNVETEVVSFNLQTPPTYNINYIYFGDIYVPATENQLVMTVNDSLGDILTFKTVNGVNKGKYPYIIWNKVDTTPVNQCYFSGYRFFIDNKPPQFNYLLTEAGEILETEAGDQIYI